MENELVRMIGKEGFCDSRMIAEKFGKNHNHVLQKIDKLMQEITSLVDEISSTKNSKASEVFVKKDREYRGQNFRYVEMNKQAFSLLAMSFTGKKALRWKRLFNDAFYQMESIILQSKQNKEIPNWVMLRECIGKNVRLLETDAVKDFVEYATEQGSKSAKMYYKHITSCVYKCLDFNLKATPSLRDTLAIRELSDLILMETQARKSFKKYMKSGEHYKAIYVLVKNDLVEYAKNLNFAVFNTQKELTK